MRFILFHKYGAKWWIYCFLWITNIDSVLMTNNLMNNKYWNYCFDNSATNPDYSTLLSNNNSVTLTQRAFKRINVSRLYTIMHGMLCAIINKIWELGTTHGTHCSGRPRHSRSLENIESVRHTDLAPRSPDLSAADFFYWSYLNKRGYIYNPQTL